MKPGLTKEAVLEMAHSGIILTSLKFVLVHDWLALHDEVERLQRALDNCMRVATKGNIN